MNETSKGDRYEILPHLPPYGPMYIPIAENGEEYYSEGFVVKFTKNDGTDWVANFKPGWTDYSFVKEFKTAGRILVIANGIAYLMNPNSEKPIKIFGVTIDYVISLDEEQIVASDGTRILIIDRTGIIWESARIAWDCIKDLRLEGNVLYGKSYDPTNDADNWVGFTINLDTKVVEGGSFKHSFKRKAWWKIWK